MSLDGPLSKSELREKLAEARAMILSHEMTIAALRVALAEAEAVARFWANR